MNTQTIQSSGLRGKFGPLPLLLAALLASLAPLARAGNEVMQRSSEAEDAVMMSMHQLHTAFDKQDIDAIGSFIADDDFLFVYELDSGATPVKLNTKAELLDWLKTTFKAFGQEKANTEAKNPVMIARANATFGIVTEECRLKVNLPGGITEIEHLRATAVARKGPDGWKFIHWHMSASAPLERITAVNVGK